MAVKTTQFKALFSSVFFAITFLLLIFVFKRKPVESPPDVKIIYNSNYSPKPNRDSSKPGFSNQFLSDDSNKLSKPSDSIGRFGFQYTKNNNAEDRLFNTKPISRTIAKGIIEVQTVKNNSFLGCLPADQINKIDGKSTIRAWNGQKFNHESCSRACDFFSHSIAVLSIRDTKRIETDCTCLESLWANIFDVTDTDWPNLCENGAYITPWGSSKCNHAKFLDPEQTAVPMVGLISVPGSGSTWTRYMFQKMTGIMAGSVYFGNDSLKYGLYGGIVPWNEGKTTLIEFHEQPNQNTEMRDKADKIVLLIRNPFESSLAEYTRIWNGAVTGFTNVQAFLNQNKEHNFPEFFNKQLIHLLQLVKTYTAWKKPVMFLFYEDLNDNLLRKLLELAEFMDLGDRPEILERSICSILGNSVGKRTKRVQKVDLTLEAAKMIDKKYAVEMLEKIQSVFVTHNYNFKRIDEYILYIKNLQKS